MRSQILQLSILILLALTTQSSAQDCCTQADKDIKNYQTLLTAAQTDVTSLQAMIADAQNNYNQACHPCPTGPCGTLVPWNIAKSPNDPAFCGLPSGNYYMDNSIMYPGTGHFSGSCNTQNPGPGRITMSKSNKGPGAYYSCGEGEKYDNVEAKYFLKHPNLKWVQTTALVGAQVPGAIAVVSAFGTGYVGRMQVSFPNGKFLQIGKLFNNKFYYTPSNLNAEIIMSPWDNSQANYTAMEILACQ